jgi:hypothetical protein
MRLHGTQAILVVETAISADEDTGRENAPTTTLTNRDASHRMEVN